MSEVMRPPLAPAPEGRNIFSPDPTPPDISEQLWPPKMPAYVESSPLTSPSPTDTERPFSTIQQRLRAEWVPVRGETPVSDMVDVFREKALHLGIELASLSPTELAGQMDEEKRERMMRKIAGAMTGCVDILTEYGFDVDQLVADKLDVVDRKYDADKFTELRVHGFPDSPGRKRVSEVSAYLKDNYDKETGIQRYELRGLPISEDEQHARFGDLSAFANWHQMRIAEFQYRSFGSDLNVAESIRPKMEEEMTEFISEFDGLSAVQINNLQSSIERDHIGEEGADFLISTMGLLAAWNECVQGSIEGKITIMKHDYKQAPILRTEHNFTARDAMIAIRTAKHRVKHGRPMPYKIAALLHIF